MACILIAGKVEECSRRVREIVNIFHWLWSSIRNQLPYRMMEYVGEEYYKWRDRVTTLELVILSELGFHVQPDQPVGLLINYLNALEMSSDVRVAQRALNYLNDGLRTVVYLCYPSPVIACAAISLAADDFGVEVPEGEPHWWVVFDVHSMKQLQQAKNVIRSAYSYKVDFTGVPLTREELSDKHQGEEGWGMEVVKKPRELPPSRSRSRERASDKSPSHHRVERSQERARDESYGQNRGRSRDRRRQSRSRSGSRPRSRFNHRSRSGEQSRRHHSHHRVINDRDYSGEHRRLHYRHRPRSRTRSRSRSRSRSRTRTRSRSGSRSVDGRRPPRPRSESRDRQGRSKR